MYCVMQLPPPASSVSNDKSRQHEANRPSCSQRHDVPRTTKSLATFTTDPRSAPVARTCAGSLPTFSGSLPTVPTADRSEPAQRTREIVHHDVLRKKMKVDTDLTEDNDDFENDLDAEMMMMIAQTTEEENCIHSSSSRTTDNWKQLHANAERNNVSSTDTTSMSSFPETLATDNRRHILETGSRTASDPGVSRCSVTGSRQTGHASEWGFSDRNVRDVKHCVTDIDIKDVKHCNVSRNSSVDGHGSYKSSSAACSTSSGSVEILLTYFIICE